jgi:hypothetical protein
MGYCVEINKVNKSFNYFYNKAVTWQNVEKAKGSEYILSALL